jgi:hypothetical protein
MAELDKLIKITVDTDEATVELNGFKTSLKDIEAAEKSLSNTLIASMAVRNKNEESIRRNITALERQSRKLKEMPFEYRAVTEEINKQKLELAAFSDNTIKTTDSMDRLRNSSGLASQTLVEVGRTVSDANYGFTAVANNLSQLSYYFVALVKDSQGVSGAFKNLGRQLLGAGGVVIAIQLVITLIEKYTLSQREAKKATEDTTKALAGAQGQIALLRQYGETIKQSSKSSLEYQGALAKLKKDGFDELTGSVEEYIEARAKLLIFEAQEKTMKDALEKLYEQRAVLEEERQKAADALVTKSFKTTVQGYAYQANAIETLNKTGQVAAFNLEKNLQSQVDAIDSQVDELLSGNKKRFDETIKSLEGNNFLCLLFGDCKKDKETTDKRLATFKQNLFDLSSEIEKYRQESLQDNSLNAEGLLEQDRGFAIAELEIKKQQFLNEEKLRKENYIKQLDEKKTQAEKDNKWTQEDEENYKRLILEADQTLKDELLEAEAEFNDAMLMLNKAFNTELQNIKDAQQSSDVEGFIRTRRAITSFQREGQIADARTEVERLELREKFRQEDLVGERMKLQNELAERKANGEAYSEIEEQLRLLDIENTRKTEESKTAIRKASLEKFASDIDKAKEYVQALADFIDADFEAQAQKEENKTNKVNNELRARLSNENLSKDEKDKINQQIAANEEKLRLKQEAIEKKRFKTEKAFRISMALMDTASSALRAYGSQLIIGDPSSIIRAQIAAAAATVLGLAQVAMIAKQQFQSSASAAPPSVSTGSTAGAETSVQAPDFNVVGQSNVSQLASLVQSQLDKPIKTYVVAKDVTTAQELDRNRVSAATI